MEICYFRDWYSWFYAVSWLCSLVLFFPWHAFQIINVANFVICALDLNHDLMWWYHMIISLYMLSQGRNCQKMLMGYCPQFANYAVSWLWFQVGEISFILFSCSWIFVLLNWKFGYKWMIIYFEGNAELGATYFLETILSLVISQSWYASHGTYFDIRSLHVLSSDNKIPLWFLAWHFKSLLQGKTENQGKGFLFNTFIVSNTLSKKASLSCWSWEGKE